MMLYDVESLQNLRDRGLKNLDALMTTVCTISSNAELMYDLGFEDEIREIENASQNALLHIAKPINVLCRRIDHIANAL